MEKKKYVYPLIEVAQTNFNANILTVSYGLNDDYFDEEPDETWEY